MTALYLLGAFIGGMWFGALVQHGQWMDWMKRNHPDEVPGDPDNSLPASGHSPETGRGTEMATVRPPADASNQDSAPASGPDA